MRCIERAIPAMRHAARWPRCASVPFLLAALAACSGPRAGGQVELRIHNEGTIAFEHAWQGLPGAGSDRDFGRIEPGRTSAWRRFPANLPHYRKTRIQLAGGRQLIDVLDPAAHYGTPTLPPGRYTLHYRAEEEGLQLRIEAVE